MDTVLKNCSLHVYMNTIIKTFVVTVARVCDRQRVSTILHIEDAQRAQRNPDRAYKPDIIDKYSQYSSGVYAPMQREGRFPDTRPLDQRIDTRPYQPSSYAELLDLEASLPQRHLMAKVQVACWVCLACCCMYSCMRESGRTPAFCCCSLPFNAAHCF